MDRKPPILERAFQLSADGNHKTVDRIRQTLRGEGYEGVNQHLTSYTIKRQLLARIKAVAKVPS